MEYTELADYPLPAGSLTEWIPRVDDDTAWNADPRPLSFTHEDHCNRSSPGSWIGTVFEIHRRFDADAVRATILAYMDRHEAFRTRAKFDDVAERWQRYSVPTKSVRISERSHPEASDETQVFRHLHSWFGESVSATSWPHFILATVRPDTPLADGVDDSFLLVFAADHSVMDAYSQIYAINEIDRLYLQALDGTDPQLPDVGSYVDYSEAERTIGDSLTTDHAAVRVWEKFLASEHGNFPAFPLPITCDTPPSGLPQSSVSSWLLTDEQADAFNGACKAAGFNMQSGVLAALALVNTRLTGRDTLRTILPMHTRSEQRWAASVGWYVGIMPLEIDLGSVTTFGDAIARAGIASGANKGIAAVPYSRVAALLGSEAIPRFVVSYIDLRFMPDAEEWAVRKGRALRSNVHADDEVYFWVNRTLQGVNISTRFPSTDVAATNVHRYIAEFVSVLTSVIEDPTRTLLARSAVPVGAE